MKNVAIIAPAGNIDDIGKLNRVEKFLEQFDISCKIFLGCSLKYRYMAGDDDMRLKDLHEAYLDPGIDTIICARGGYGAIRLLDRIDYNIIKNNPKKFVGSSDITALLVSIYKNTGQITYHAKMALSGISAMSQVEFLKYKEYIENDVYESPKFQHLSHFSSDKTADLSGNIPLWGGNLATIVSMFGSRPESYILNEDMVLFLEDINEPEYKIDRMLTQILRNEPLKNRIKAVIFGEFMFEKSSHKRFLNEILMEFINVLNVPYAFDENITHGPKNTVVPVGKRIFCK